MRIKMTTQENQLRTGKHYYINNICINSNQKSPFSAHIGKGKACCWKGTAHMPRGWGASLKAGFKPVPCTERQVADPIRNTLRLGLEFGKRFLLFPAGFEDEATYKASGAAVFI